MSVNPLGVSSGMDINAMVSKIVDSERLPKQQRIDNDRAKIDTSISAYGRLRESLDTMKNLMANFRQEKAFAVRTVESSDENAVSATATTEAIAGRYAIDVLQLAQSHKVASEALSDDLKFGPGKLHIGLGDEKFTVDVKDRSKLVDVVRGINGATGNPGVRASIINDANGQRLIVASDKSGVENTIKISAESDAGNPLSKFEYKTLEERVKSLEEARNAAADALAAPLPGQDVANQQLNEQGEPIDKQAASDPTTADGQSAADKTAGLATDGESASSLDASIPVPPVSVLPEDNIPGWSETASGTLLDSYTEPAPELDAKALEKMPDIPGWNNTASGTLTDSYVTPKEASAAEQARLAEEKAAIAEAVATGQLTEEQAYQLELQRMSPEERARQLKIDETQQALKAAEESLASYDGMTEVQEAQDAMVMLDGIAQLSSENNVIEDAIDGIDLTVKGVTDPTKQKTEIGVEYDRKSVRDDIEQFVNAYNQFYQVSKELSAVDPQTGVAGPLAGDSVVRSAQSRLKSVFSANIEPAPDDLKTLTEFGITGTRQGTLEINYDMLDRQLNNNFTKLEDFFGGQKGFAKKVEDAIQSMTGITGPIRTREKSLLEQNYRLNDNQTSLNQRMESLEERTKNKFMAMQDATTKMQGQLSGMMNALGQ
ncbi:flagellar filament capping protein FliD [Vibrio sp. SCSIO 43137]|uniref:flagellar filament capping protein FliD n=1 Tax=Vibrio sp. SCSIO 43137 TaxID=3021011 RepID=UPI0023077567|nr:flagellar filament capping protein FliD [Vibrio sp. SCSIO 43137]WCE28983.1 flagellar filament capping protein FliD [Vibrio sp. SCSIO 43137]